MKSNEIKGKVCDVSMNITKSAKRGEIYVFWKKFKHINAFSFLISFLERLKKRH